MSLPIMPKRSPQDGPAGIEREADGLRLRAEDDGETETMFVSEFNAWRLFGMLSVMLGLPLAPKVSKAIKLGSGSVAFQRPAGTTLGDRVAAHLAHEAFVETLKKDGYLVEEKDGQTSIQPPKKRRSPKGKRTAKAIPGGEK